MTNVQCSTNIECAYETLRLMKEYQENNIGGYKVNVIKTFGLSMKQAMESIGVFEENVLVAVDEYFSPNATTDTHIQYYNYLEHLIEHSPRIIKPKNVEYSKSEIMCKRLLCMRTAGPYMNKEVSKLLGKETLRCFETDTKRDLIAYDVQGKVIELLESPDLTVAVNIYHEMINILHKKGRY